MVAEGTVSLSLSHICSLQRSWKCYETVPRGRVKDRGVMGHIRRSISMPWADSATSESVCQRPPMTQPSETLLHRRLLRSRQQLSLPSCNRDRDVTDSRHVTSRSSKWRHASRLRQRESESVPEPPSRRTVRLFGVFPDHRILTELAHGCARTRARLEPGCGPSGNSHNYRCTRDGPAELGVMIDSHASSWFVG